MKYTLLFLLLTVAVTLFGTTIHDIQYTTVPGSDGTYPSTMVNQTVTVQAIVTGYGYTYSATSDDKYFVCDPAGGAWSGIYVYDWTNQPQAGDLVQFTAVVKEYYGFTELQTVTNFSIISSGNQIPAPLAVTTGQIATAATAEMYEGCLVKIQNVSCTVVPNNFGEFKVDDGSGACQIDNEFFSPTNPFPVTPIVGTQFSRIIGLVDYSRDFYGINPRSADDVSQGPVSFDVKSWGKIKSQYK